MQTLRLSRSTSKSGLSWIEVLILTAIVSVVLAIFVPDIIKARANRLAKLSEPDELIIRTYGNISYISRWKGLEMISLGNRDRALRAIDDFSKTNSLIILSVSSEGFINQLGEAKTDVLYFTHMKKALEKPPL